jgi:c(7)-type cytochrome triheme protein
MKKLFVSACLLLTLATIALAVPAGKELKFEKSSMGTVTFSGQIHKDAGASCKECHNADMFPKMKQGTVEIKMDKIYAGELCGKCHDGKRAFSAKADCVRCHKK